jgi:hypothetical protein
MECNAASHAPTESSVVVQVVTVIMGTVVGLTFLFAFGNVLHLALRLGVPVWVAPLVAPAVDLSILGLLLGTRHLALAGASAEILRPARRLLIFASVVTLALNVADPLVTGEFGKAAFDAVGPLLLIGWAEVGPSFLRAISVAAAEPADQESHGGMLAESAVRSDGDGVDEPARPDGAGTNDLSQGRQRVPHQDISEDLLEQARREDAAHRATHQKPVSAETLRTRLGIGATRARHLVKVVRAEYQALTVRERTDSDAAIATQDASTPLEGAGRFG